MLKPMDHTPHTIHGNAPGPRLTSPLTAVSTLVRPDQPERQLLRLHKWRERLESDGYQTMLSLVSPCGLIVRDRLLTDRWLALSPDHSIAFFQRDASGHVRCQHLVVEALDRDSDAASALVASATVRRFLQRERR